jgi:hypothetical protein
MTLPKLLAFFSLVLFGIIGTIALFKEKPPSHSFSLSVQGPLEIELDQEIQTLAPALVFPPQVSDATEKKQGLEMPSLSSIELPDANRIEELFNKTDPRLPIVETITYKSHVPWQKGRPAWLSDYASHYETSRHFIARSLNGKPDYFKQDLAEGDRFNVLRKDKNFEFYLLVDTSRCRLWFYTIDLDTKQKTLLKTYQVGLGRLDASKASGLLTPLGKYSLGERVAVYKPKTMGIYQGKQTEMITIFGTRWIPFDKEIANCTAPAKGFGIHGTPWIEGKDEASGIGKYESDGCIRLATPDMEELFAIIITKPTTIEIVRDFMEVHP